MHQVTLAAPDQRSIVLARIAATLTVLTVGVVLLGWLFDISVFKSVLPGWVTMKANTAVAFAFAGVALWLTTIRTPSKAQRLLARSGGIVVALIGLLTASEYLTGMDLGIDQLLFTEPQTAVATSNPGRMAPATALNFLLLGCALSAVGPMRRFHVFQVLVLSAGLIGLLNVVSYLYSATLFSGYTQMAFHTALLFCVLSSGVLCTRKDGGLMALLSSDTVGGMTARRLLLPALAIPIVIGWLRLVGQSVGWYGTQTGTTLHSLSNVLVFGGLVWATATGLQRSDWQRQYAEYKLRAQLQRMNLLHHITRAIGERQDLKSIFQVVIRSVEDSLPIDFGCICLYDALSESLTVTSVGVRSAALATELAMSEQARVGIDQNGLSRCVRGQLVYEPDIRAIAFPFPQRLASGGLGALVAAPLLIESKVFGVLIVARRDPHSFSSDDCEFLRQLGEHVALASHQAQLYTALQQAYDDLRLSQHTVIQQERLRALGQMASGIAHDINNAISPISLYTESLLEREAHLSERGRGFLVTIARAIDDVAETVARMREFYRPHDAHLAQAPIAINNLVSQVVELTRARWRDLAQQRGVFIDMRIDLDAGLPKVMGVESEIRDALTNLIFNAVDAMPEGGTLTLHTRSVRAQPGALEPTHVVLEVRDTGMGMDEETRRRCLEPFFTTKGERGTGLGLAMVYGMAQRHNADLEIDSQLQRGSVIRLIFHVATGMHGQTLRPTAPQMPTRNLRILVIDDDPLLIKSLRDTLAADGHSIAVADGGQVGIDMFMATCKRGEPFDVVMTDLGMPHVDGRKVAAAIKTASSLTPVIMLTGWGQRLLAENDMPLHVDRVLNKPPKLAELRATLAELTAAAVVGN